MTVNRQSLTNAAQSYIANPADRALIVEVAIASECCLMHAASLFYQTAFERTAPRCALCGSPSRWPDREGAIHPLCAARAARGGETPALDWTRPCACSPCRHD